MCARFDAAARSSRAARFLVEWELLMPQPMVRRIALRALQAALAGAGIFVIMDSCILKEHKARFG